jgi:hypothetical protein
MYTSDLPPPTGIHEYVLYADDVTQIIPYQGRSKNMHELSIRRAILAIDNFEHKWKIQTEKGKFQVITIANHQANNIVLPDRTITHSPNGKVLGLRIQRQGFNEHVKVRIEKAKSQLIKLRRFRNLNAKNKRLIYQALVQSKLTYPAIPLHTISKTQMLKLQRVQNEGLRYVTNTSRQDHVTIERLHEMTDMNPINIILHQQAQRTWTNMTLTMTQDELDKFIPKYGTDYKATFPSSRLIATGPDPEPLYK